MRVFSKILSFGAEGRTRTGTVSLPVDFESTTSANSITPASVKSRYYYNAYPQKNQAFLLKICRGFFQAFLK